MSTGGRAVLLGLFLIGGAAAGAADLSKLDVVGIRLRAPHTEVAAALAKLGADAPIENVTCPAEVTGVCLREMSVTIASPQRRELLAIQFIEDADHKTREVYDLRYRDLPLQRETADDFLRHAQRKFGTPDLSLTNGSFYWGAVIEKGTGRDRIDQTKPFVMVDPIQRIVQLSDPSFFAARRAELAEAARDAARKATEQTILPRF